MIISRVPQRPENAVNHTIKCIVNRNRHNATEETEIETEEKRKKHIR